MRYSVMNSTVHAMNSEIGTLVVVGEMVVDKCRLELDKSPHLYVVCLSPSIISQCG